MVGLLISEKGLFFVVSNLANRVTKGTL